MTSSSPEDGGFEALLRNAFGDDASDPATSPASARRVAVPPRELEPGELLGGRYRVAAEIGRGGVGVVYRAHDSVLRRDVAVKVLDVRHVARPALFDRFFEEAQVIAQLEHPGIVPVHDVGLAADGRPFFVMKLLGGRTLAALLEERGDALATLLEVFEQVCRAVAHAHDHGVVHRDLKPSNVIVGDLGDVQVLDWGMSKVLGAGEFTPQRKGGDERRVATVRTDSGGSTASVTGSVFGTPAYMPPEQARGEVDALDARSDVFALGALLCEIVTGHAPYTGSKSEIQRRARDGDLSAAFAALAAAPVDTEVRALATDCLAPAPVDRPADARAVAERIARHRRAVDERVRAAEVRIVAAEARTDAERRTRRWQLGAAGSVLVLIIVAGAAWQIQAARAAARGTRVAREVGEALDEVTALRQQPTPADDAEAWQAIRAALARARAVATSSDANSEVESRIAAVAVAVERDLERARGAAARRKRDAEIVARLEQIRGTVLTDLDYARADRELTELFASLGVEIGAPDRTAASAKELRASRILPELVTGLDTWGWCRKSLELPTSDADRTAIRELASSVDPDPLRARIRLALTGADVTELDELATELEATDPSPETAVLAAAALRDAGDRGRGLALMRQAFARHPDHAWLAYVLWQEHEFHARNPEESFRFITAAAAANPNALLPNVNLAAALAERQRLPEARAVLERLHARYPTDCKVLGNLGLVRWQLGDAEAGEALLRESLRLEPRESVGWSMLVTMLERTGRIDDALATLAEAIAHGTGTAEFEVKIAWLEQGRGHHDAARAAATRALAANPERTWAQFVLALACESLGDRAGAIAAYRRAAAGSPTRYEPLYNLGLLLEEDLADRDAAIATFRRAAEIVPDAWQPRWDLARMLFEDSDFAGAIPVLRELVELAPDSPVPESQEEGRLVEALTLLAKSAHALHDDQALFEAMRPLAVHRPDNWQIHASLGAVAFRLGETGVAETAWRRTTELAPTEPGAWVELGRARHTRGDYAGCVAACDQALALDAGYGAAWAYLGRARLDRGELDVAASALQQGIERGGAEPPWELPIADWLAECARRQR